MQALENSPGNSPKERARIPYGYAKKEIILDAEGNPIDWKYLEVNAAFERHTGIAVDGLVGKHNSEIMPDIKMYQDWLDIYYKVAFHDTEEEFVNWAEPLKKWFNVNVYSPQRGQVIVFLQDVTKFEEERKMYSDILTHISDAVFVTNNTGDFTYVSPNTSRIFGYTESEVFELKNIQSLFGEELYNIAELKETGEVSNIEKCARTKSGKKLDFLINISKVKVAEGSILFTCREITERLRIEREREQHAAQLKAFMNAIPDMVWIKDHKGKYLSCNKEFEKLYGVSEQEIKGKDDFYFLGGAFANVSRENDRTAIISKDLIKYEETLIMGEDPKKKVIVETTKTPVYNSSSELVGVLGVARDITERKSIENQLIKANRDLNFQVQKLNLAMKNNGILAWETDLEGLSTEVFPTGAGNQNIPKVNVSHLDEMLDQIRNDHRSQFKGKLQKLERGEIDHFTSEFQLMDKAIDDWIWYQSDISVLERSDEGSPKRIFGTILNINEKKDSEKMQVLSQEQERVRVARDIHDSIGQLLVGTRMMLNQTLDKDVSYKKLRKLNVSIDKMLGDMIHESRLIINNFGISIAENDDLKRSFIELAEKMKKIYKGAIHLNWEGESNTNSLLHGVHIV